MMRSRYALLGVLIVVGTDAAHAIAVDAWELFTQPDGTTFVGHIYGDEIAVNWETADGYAFVYNPTDEYLYYAALDSKGDYRASAAKVGIDDPVTHGIPKHLQRSAARRAALQAARIAQGYVKTPAEEGAFGQSVGPHFGDPAHADCTGSSPCDVYVVMVTFEDSRSDTTDQPWGYPMALFEQFFNGGYEGVPAYTGTIAHTSATQDSTENLEVFGSLRAYFHQVHGEDILHFTILNECENDPCGETDEPVWIPLNSTTHPNTKEWYAADSASTPADFWDVAEDAAGANLTLPADFPLRRASANIQLTNKVLYLYAGYTYNQTPTTAESPLHPRVNHVTDHTTNVGRIGARYVMGERQGHHNTERNADRFAGIGMHVHEIGHLFGFVHPDGGWAGTNPYTNQTTGDVVDGVTVRFSQANLSGWGSMQNGEHGPAINPNNWAIPHRSCPQPYNPFYRMDIGWNTRHDITATTPNQRIEPGPSHYYLVNGANGHAYILDYRTNSNFGQYTYFHRFTSSPGLLIWRRTPSNRATNPMLIPADGRSISDARPRPATANPRVPAWRDRLSDPFRALAQPHGPTVIQATDASHLQHATYRIPGRNQNSGSANPDPGPSHLAFRNIRNEGTHAFVDIYINYWSGPITDSETWSGTVYVGGDVTIPDGVTLTLTSGTEVRFLADTDDTGGGTDGGRSEIIVEDGGTLDADAGNITFRSSNAPDDASRSDWYGIVVEDGGTADLSNATVRDGSHCAQVSGTGTLTAENTVFRNCGLAPPSPPESLEATPGNGEVALLWEAADSNGSDILRYETQYIADSGSTWSAWATVARGESARRDTVDGLTNGTQYTFQVRAVNGEGAGAGGSTTATPAAQPPDAPRGLTATGGDEEVVLEWTTPDDNGEPITGYVYRDSSHAGTSWTAQKAMDGSDSRTTTYTVGGLTNGTTYTFEVWAINNAGAGVVSSTTATPQFIINESETTSVPFAEIPKGTETWDNLVATYTTNKAEDTPVTWSVGGTDKSAFVITETDGAGTLSFSAAPDFETQPTYAVTVQAQVRVGTPTASMASLDVTVEVENVEEAGSIGLPSTPPKVGTAVVAELTDPDGSITGACWIWQRAPDATSTTWEDRTACPDGVAASVRAESAEPYPELSSYTPEKDDIGYLLRATVTYNDGQGDGKDKQSDPTATAVAVPSVPRDLTTAPDDGQMLLSWRAPSSDGESAITG